jgi:hypothetical protein
LSETNQTTTLHPGSIAAVVVGFAMANLLVPSILTAGPGTLPLVVVFFGVVAAEGGLLTFWAVLGPHRLLVRFSSALATAALLLLVLLLGIAASEQPSPRDLFDVLLLLPLMSLAPQTPIWVFKWILGCRTASSADGGDRAADASGLSARQFGLIDILGATTFFAIALGLVNSWVKLQSRGMAPGWELQLWMESVLIPLAVVGVWSLFTILPCIWAAFFVRNGGVGALLVLLFTGLIWLMFGIIASVLSGGVPPPSDAVGPVLLFLGSQMATMYGCMRLIRACGYELIRPKRAAKPATLPEHDGHAQEPEP